MFIFTSSPRLKFGLTTALISSHPALDFGECMADSIRASWMRIDSLDSTSSSGQGQVTRLESRGAKSANGNGNPESPAKIWPKSNEYLKYCISLTFGKDSEDELDCQASKFERRNYLDFSSSAFGSAQCASQNSWRTQYRVLYPGSRGSRQRQMMREHVTLCRALKTRTHLRKIWSDYCSRAVKIPVSFY
jgi:hypothetical protein